MMVSIFNGNPRTTIISCNTPTNVSEETELHAFYDELFSLVRSIPKHSVLVIGGDMTAQIGEKRKPQIQPTQLVQQEWTTSNRFHDRKYIMMPQYKLLKKGEKITDLLMRKQY